MLVKQGMRLLIILIATIFVSGCASHHYRHVQEEELHGKLIVQWIDYDEFIFIPDRENPLTFVRHNGEKITPQRIHTDGGSIPRIFWAFRSYSPWGYAPAFIVHDWLFEMQHCKIPGYENYDVKKAAWIMSEIIKTLMEDPTYGGKNKLVLYSMYEGVRSPIAKHLWENGECDMIDEGQFEQFKKQFEQVKRQFGQLKKQPFKQYVIEFP